ncbi:amino acid permease, partial [Bacillus cereus]|nr:amino acid permease [Bacillus cereus]
MLLNLSRNTTLKVSLFKLAHTKTKLCITQVIEKHNLFFEGDTGDMGKLFKKKSVTQLLDHNKSKNLTKTLGLFDLIML